MAPSPTLKKILSNSAILMAEKVTSISVNLGVTLMLTRTLLPEQWGQLSYLLALVGLLLPFTSVGLNALVSQFLLKYPEQRPKVLGTAISIRLLGAIGGGLLLYWVAKAWLITDRTQLQLLLILLMGSAMLAFTGIRFYFESIVQARFSSMVRLSAILTAAAAKLWAVTTGQPLTILVTIFAIESAMIGLLFVIVYSLHAKDIWQWRWSKNMAKELLSRSGWLIFSSIFAVIYLKIDQIMLGKMTSMAEVGHYALAARLSEVWMFIPFALVASAYPALVKLYEGNNPNYHKRLQQSCDALLGIAFTLAIIIQLLSEPAITLLFGENYRPAAPILQLHIWSALFIFMRALASRWLILEDLVKYSLYSHLTGAIVNVLVNWALIPIWGGKGAAIATFIAYATAGWLIFYISQQTRPMAQIMTRSLLWPTRFISHRFANN